MLAKDFDLDFRLDAFVAVAVEEIVAETWRSQIVSIKGMSSCEIENVGSREKCFVAPMSLSETELSSKASDADLAIFDKH